MKGLGLIISICTIFISNASFAQEEFAFKLDIPLDSAGLNSYPYIGETGIFTGPSSHVKGKEYKIGESKVAVGLDEHSNIVYYLSCDTNFIINKYRYLGDERKYLDSLKKNSKLIYEDGFAAYFPIGNGWNLSFNYLDVSGSKRKGYVLKADAKPKCVFKESVKPDGDAKLEGKVTGTKVRN